MSKSPAFFEIEARRGETTSKRRRKTSQSKPEIVLVVKQKQKGKKQTLSKRTVENRKRRREKARELVRQLNERKSKKAKKTDLTAFEDQSTGDTPSEGMSSVNSIESIPEESRRRKELEKVRELMLQYKRESGSKEQKTEGTPSEWKNSEESASRGAGESDKRRKARRRRRNRSVRKREQMWKKVPAAKQYEEKSDHDEAAKSESSSVQHSTCATPNEGSKESASSVADESDIKEDEERKKHSLHAPLQALKEIVGTFAGKGDPKVRSSASEVQNTQNEREKEEVSDHFFADRAMHKRS
ncbi:unnamed protein product [Cylicocyclus nassatus]|uniref:Uncharacterized protein n=1 Tax=Cylicocyclus nassatus TaxID=53992 RepID=A0AA36GIC4_CYLNA|nr:unnamed protein product [Cylicocyclus nassatus]